MLKLSKKSDYGLLIISKLLHTEDFVSLSKLVEHTKLPLRFLARISAELAHNGILISREGRVGGYKLGKKFNELSAYDFFSVFESNLNMTGCQGSSGSCAFEHICKHKDFVKCNLQKIILDDLKKVKLSELFN